MARTINTSRGRLFAEYQKEIVEQNGLEMDLSAETMSQTKIVDIDNDCLERVFEQLELRDLVYVAEANKNLGVAAATVFKRKLKKRTVIIDYNFYIEIVIYDDAVCIHNSLLAVQMIRRFGQSISAIKIKLSTNETFMRGKFFIHVNEYCHKTLNTLLTCGRFSGTFSAAKYPFESVTEFSSTEGIVGDGCEHFNRLFPCLRRLKVVDNIIVDWKYISNTFPNMNAFTFKDHAILPQNATEDFLKTIVTLNPQLEFFKLIGYYDPNIWRFINAKLTNLKSICASYSPSHANSFTGEPIQFDSVETFDVLGVESYKNISHTFRHPIDVFSFKRLRKITVRCFFHEFEMWIDFVLSHPTIEVFELVFMGYFIYRRLEYIEQQLNKVRQNKKIKSFWIKLEPYECEYLPIFLNTHQCFDGVTVDFGNTHRRAEMEHFYKLLKPKLKKYKMTKIDNVFMKSQRIDFERCE